VSEAEIARGVKALCRVDPDLRPLVRAHGHPNLVRTRNAFESLARAIVYQQLSGKAAGTIYRRFLALFPGGRFPTAQRLASTGMDDLRAVGLSRQKASYLLDLADKFASGSIAARRFARASEDDLRATLKQVKGIGDWSVDMFLIFALVRLDVLPTGDLGVRKGMAEHFGLAQLPGPAKMEALAERWRPYRSLASWYMWRRLEG